MLGKPLIKLSAKQGFEQNTCFRRTGNGGRTKEFRQRGGDDRP